MRQLYFVVQRRVGPAWRRGTPLEDQPGWPEHAAFMDALADRGWLVLGGPLQDEERVVLVCDARDEEEVRSTLGADPWAPSMLSIATIDAWTIRLDGRAAAGLEGPAPSRDG